MKKPELADMGKSLLQFYDAELDVSDILAVERYQGHTLIDKGANKEVFKVTDTHCAREVALARIKEGVFSLENALDFVREVQIASSFEHPNIIRIYDVGISEGRPWFTMELSSEKTLTTHIDETSLSLSEKIEIFIQLCDAVQYAHERDVLHLDLKPNNVSIGKTGQVLLSDWGLATSLKTRPEGDLINSQGQIGKIKGSLGYMAPEQTRPDSPNTNSADIFGLGAILYYLLTQEAPILGKKREEILANTRVGSLKRLTRRKIPERLTPVLRKVLSPNLIQRYSTVAELKKDMEAFRDGYSTKAENASLWQEVTLFYKRNKLFSRITLLSLALLIGLSCFYITSLKSNEENARAAQRDAELREQEAISLRAEAENQRALTEEALRNVIAAEETTKRTNKDYSEVLYGNALDLIAKEMFAEALKTAKEAVERDPNNTVAQRRLGVIYFIQQDLPKTSEHFAKLGFILNTKAQSIITIHRDNPAPIPLEPLIKIMDELSDPFVKICLYKYDTSIRSPRQHAQLMTYMLAKLNSVDSINLRYSPKYRTLYLTENPDLKRVYWEKTHHSAPFNLLSTLPIKRLILDDTLYNRKNYERFKPHNYTTVIFR